MSILKDGFSLFAYDDHLSYSKPSIEDCNLLQSNIDRLYLIWPKGNMLETSDVNECRQISFTRRINPVSANCTIHNVVVVKKL